jgi:tetratricopeptide (TPR) repeat protein
MSKYTKIFNVTLVIALVFLFNFNCYAQTNAASNKAEEYFRQGLHAAANDMDDQAIMYYKKSIEINPSNPMAYLPLVVALLQKKNYDQALPYINKLIELWPNDFTAYSTRGFIYLQERDFDKAIDDFNKNLDIIQNQTPAELEKHRSFMSLQEYKKVLRKFQAKIYLDRAKAFLGKENYEKSWDDEHKGELLGGEIDLKFVEDLKKASGRDK